MMDKDYIDIPDDEAVTEFRECMDKANKIVREKGWTYNTIDWSFARRQNPCIDHVLDKLSEEVDKCVKRVTFNKNEILSCMDTIKNLSDKGLTTQLNDFLSTVINEIKERTTDVR